MSETEVANGRASPWRIDDPLIAPLIPIDRRDDVLLLWRLDARLSQIATTGQEPALRQIRMRWWADQLHSLADNNIVAGEPLIAALGERLRGHAAAVADLGEAWAELMADPGQSAAAGLRGERLFALTATLLGTTSAIDSAAGQGWGIADAIICRDGENAWWAQAHAYLDVISLSGLPRALAALSAASRAQARRHGVVSPRRDQLTILRVGLIGR
jgi:hypothetical protein